MIARLRRYLAGTGLGPQVVRGLLGSGGLRIAGMGFGFLVGVQLARALGAEGYGVYGVAMSIVALLTVPTEFGLPQLLTREVAAAQAHGDWGRVHGVLRWTTRVSMLAALLVAAAIVAWLLVPGPRPASPLGAALLAGTALVPLVALLSLRSAALRGLQRIVGGQVAEVALRPAFHSLLLFLAPLLFAATTPALAMALGAAATGAALLVAQWMLRRALPPGAPAVSAADARRWWSAALPMAATEGMRLLHAHLLILLLGAMVALSEVGVYRVASSVALLVAMPVSLFNIVGAPVIARLHAVDDRARLQRLLAGLAAGMLLCTAALALPFALAGRPILAALFGAPFAAGHAVLLWLCAGVLANAFFGAAAATLNMTGRQGRVTRASLASLALLAVAAPPLVHAWGIPGAAVAHLLATASWSALMWRDARRLLGLDTSALAILRTGLRA
ncbi:lipopolysaccharide biosynthesis protein [Luteimonas sp. Y-2-2-4F]|nr:lipopolysaccharide biosynthesis protein [Luteimonas sp. Y-2-2-4F]